MPRPIHAIIDRTALRNNLSLMRTAAHDSRLWAIVKANGYGHGLQHIYPALQGADGIALLDLNAAQQVRDLGWRGPILLLEGIFEPRDLEICSRLQLTSVVHTLEQVEMLALHKTQQPHAIYLKLNTGMNRLGLSTNIYRATWTRLNAMPQVGDITLMTHFGLADAKDGIEEQLKCFTHVTRDLPGERSVANSSTILRHYKSIHPANSDWVRAGIALYGCAPDYPSNSAQHWGLKPVMSLRTKIINVQHLVAGDYVGYGAAYRANHPMRLGVIACGYADGYMRNCGKDTPILIAGIRSCLIGRVSMDMITVDISHIPQATFGTSVTLWGQSENGEILSIDETASHAQTIGYELMCGLTNRVPIMVID
jgi:alanine racemase